MPRAARKALVVAGDVSLGRLSEFVRVFSSDGYGDSAVLSADFQGAGAQRHAGRDARWSRPRACSARCTRSGWPTGTASTATTPTFAFTYEGRRYLVQTSLIPSTGWQLVSWVPEDMVLGGLRRAVLWGLLLALVFLGLALFMSLKLSKLVTAPVENLSRIARRIGLLELDNLPREPSRVLEIQHLDQALDDSPAASRPSASSCR
jgi:adenylate cyclase